MEVFGLHAGNLIGLYGSCLGLIMMVYSFWILRKSKQLKLETDEELRVFRSESEDFLKESKEFYESKGIIDTQNILKEQFKDIENYNKLSFKQEWYLFNLQSLALKIKNGYSLENPDFDVIKAVEYIGVAWCKTPDDVFKDYLIIAGHYILAKKPVYNSKGEKIGVEASNNHSKIAGAGYKES